jgi:hypothetical protein
VDVTACIDAVDHDGVAQENDKPDSDFHLNIYETITDVPRGGPVADLQPQDRQINVTADWDRSLDHYHIDDDSAVQQEVLDWIDGHIDP